MELFPTIFLGVVQGITEFLPISSTGHLILSRALVGITGENALAFDAILHLATAGAVIVYYFDELWSMVQTLLRKLGRLPVNETDMRLMYTLAVGTVPAVILGLLLEDLMGHAFREPLLVAVVLIAGSIMFMAAEYVYQNRYHEKKLDIPMGLKIGFFQALALIPGMSRSGSTISGGMFLGLTRSEATKFAFLLAIPVILGAGAKKTLELLKSDTPVEWFPIICGAAVAFLVGLAAIHFMVTFLKKHTLWPFIWYRIILAGFVIFVITFG